MFYIYTYTHNFSSLAEVIIYWYNRHCFEKDFLNDMQKIYLSSVRFFNFKFSVRIQKINAVSGRKKRDMVKHIYVMQLRGRRDNNEDSCIEILIFFQTIFSYLGVQISSDISFVISKYGDYF